MPSKKPTSKTYEYSVENGPFGFIYRPFLPNLKIEIGSKSFPTEGLLDTGSGDTVINQSIAEGFFGLDVSILPKTPVGGFGKEDQIGYCARVNLKLIDFDTTITIPVIFTYFAGDIVLGDTFFENFIIVFDRPKAKFTLTYILKLMDDFA